MHDPYQTLGLDRSASADDIKRAYRRLASQHHPDKGGDTQTFQTIQTAYDVLSDPQRRAQLDAPQFSRADTHMGGFDFDTIFNIFGARFSNGGSQNMPARIQLWIMLRDVAQGGPRTIAVSSPAGQQNIEITLPAGIEDGASVRYPRMAPGGTDLVVTFRIRPEMGWTRQGDSVTKDVMIDMWDLVLGKDIEVETLCARAICVTIPAMTQPGTMLRVRGHGLPRSSATTVRGDMFVRLHARLPDKISPELLDMITKERPNK